MIRQLIINADDLGLSPSTNMAVLQAHAAGRLTSASLMANMSAFDHAMDWVVAATPQLGVGVHLCLTSGRPVLAPAEVPLLVDGQGRFRHSPASLWWLLCRRRADALAQIRREWTSQVQKVEDRGVTPDHVNSHEHVHMLPGLFPIAARLAGERGAAIRVADEPWGLGAWQPSRLLARIARGGLLKKLILSRLAHKVRAGGLAGTSVYFGVLDGGLGTPVLLRQNLRSLPQGISELSVHLGLAGPKDIPDDVNFRDAAFHRAARRAAELSSLLDDSVSSELLARGIALVRFRDVRAASPQAV
jgi:chitin disaccharide deacetylase